MTQEWSVVLRQPEADRWQDLAVWAFFLRHPNALKARELSLSDGLQQELARFYRVGEELHVLEYDLTSILFEFKNAYQVLYREPEDLALKKFSIVYHTDNFNVRVHKLIESVEALLALLVDVDPARRPGLSRQEMPRPRRASSGWSIWTKSGVSFAVRRRSGQVDNAGTPGAWPDLAERGGTP